MNQMMTIMNVILISIVMKFVIKAVLNIETSIKLELYIII